MLILLFSNGLMLFNYYFESVSEKAKSNSQNYENKKSFVTVLERDGSEIKIGEIIKDNYLNLIIMISLNSCPSCLYEKRIWNEFSKSKYVNVFAVVKAKPSEEVDMWIKNLGLEFKTYYDGFGYVDIIQSELGVSELPLKMLTDSTGKILSYNGPNPNIEEQSEWFSMIKSKFILFNQK